MFSEPLPGQAAVRCVRCGAQGRGWDRRRDFGNCSGPSPPGATFLLRESHACLLLHPSCSRAATASKELWDRLLAPAEGFGQFGALLFYCWGRITTFAFRIGSCRGATAAVVWKAPEAGPWGGDRGLSHAAPWWRHFSAPQPSQSAAASGARLQLKRD